MDGIHLLNASRVLASCRADGLILKPSRPLYPAESCFDAGVDPFRCYTYHTYTELPGWPRSFVLYEDSSGMWRVQAVTVEGTAFTNRLGLLEPWRGLRDAELCAKAGIDGCKFVHASGFIGGNATYEGALAMALKTIEASNVAVD